MFTIKFKHLAIVILQSLPLQSPDDVSLSCAESTNVTKQILAIFMERNVYKTQSRDIPYGFFEAIDLAIEDQNTISTLIKIIILYMTHNIKT